MFSVFFSQVNPMSAYIHCEGTSTMKPKSYNVLLYIVLVCASIKTYTYTEARIVSLKIMLIYMVHIIFSTINV